MTQTKDTRQQTAKQLKAESDALTPKQKIEKLDKKLGVGKGAEKERKRLQALIDDKKGDTPYGEIFKKKEKEQKSENNNR